MTGRNAALPDAARKQARADIMATILVVVGLIIAMQIASAYVPDYVLPPPLQVLRAMRDLLLTDKMQVAITILRLAAAVAVSTGIGIVLGIAMGTIPTIRPFLRALIIIDTGIPALSWMLVAVFWFRNVELRIFFILSVILLPFYALNVYEGIRALPRELLDMAESFRPSRVQVLRYLILPHIVPYVFLTTRSVIGYAIRMVVFAELVAAAVGIGARMSLAESTFRIDAVFAWTVYLVILNLGLQYGVGALEKISLKWRPEAVMR